MAVRRALLSLVLVGLVAMTACSPTDGEPRAAAPKQKMDQRLHDLLPAKIRKSGRLAVAQGNNYPPLVFLDSDNKTVIGMEPDLMKAIGEVLGVKVDFSQTNFDSLIAGVHAHRYDLAIQAMLDKPERREGHLRRLLQDQQFDAGPGQGRSKISRSAISVRKAGAVEQGTAQADDAEQQNQKCTEAGKPAVKVLVFPDTVGCMQAVSTSGQRLRRRDPHHQLSGQEVRGDEDGGQALPVPALRDPGRQGRHRPGQGRARALRS